MRRLLRRFWCWLTHDRDPRQHWCWTCMTRLSVLAVVLALGVVGCYGRTRCFEDLSRRETCCREVDSLSNPLEPATCTPWRKGK